MKTDEADLEKRKEEQTEREYQSQLSQQRSRLKAAYYNENGPKVLELLGEEKPNGTTLYKLFELMQQGGKQPAFLKRFGVTKTEFDRFRDAVHNPAVTGATAEAVSFVRRRMGW